MCPSAGKVTVVNEAHLRINLRTEGAILRFTTSFEDPLLARFDFLTMLTTKIAGFWEVTPYNLAEFYPCSLTTCQEGIREAELKNRNWKRCKEKERHINYNQRQQAGRKRAGKRRTKKEKERKK
jgi:hypothetical protein